MNQGNQLIEWNYGDGRGLDEIGTKFIKPSTRKKDW